MRISDWSSDVCSSDLNDGTPESALTIDEMLDNIMLYWLPNNGASSARLYWESADAFKGQKLDLPVGVTIFPEEIFRPSRRWAERTYPKLMHWNEVAKGGHFAAFEQPDIFVDALRTCFRTVRYFRWRDRKSTRLNSSH